MNLFTASIGLQPQERRGFQNVFGRAMVFSLILGGTVTAVAAFGWVGLIVGPVAGFALAGWWLESDSFFD